MYKEGDIYETMQPKARFLSTVKQVMTVKLVRRAPVPPVMNRNSATDAVPARICPGNWTVQCL